MKVASDALQLVTERIKESVDVKLAILGDRHLMTLVLEVAHACMRGLKSGGKIIFFGNGGSAADAQHLAAELTGRYLKERRALAAIALTSNTSCLTAIGNDYGFDMIFARQIQAIGREGDIAIGISTSGNSNNVVRALRTARGMNLKTVGITGATGGQLRHELDYCLCVPSDKTPRIQEAHILLGHILCEIIEEDLVCDGHIS